MNAHIALSPHRPAIVPQREPSREIVVPAAKPGDRQTEGAGATNPLTLPRWADNNLCRLLLSIIQEERPARNRVLTVDDWNEPSEIGYVGKNASRLRAIAEAAMLDMYAALPRPKRDYPGQPVDTSEFDRRRDELIAFFRENGADALIGRVLS